MNNQYKMLFTVRQSPFNGLWLITVEGVLIDTAKTEDEAHEMIRCRWGVFPGDCLKEIYEVLDHELRQVNRFPRSNDEFYDAGRHFQRISELADAGMRIAMLTRNVK